jgi:hypothetical protein
MSKLLAFLGGAAEGLSSEIEKAEKSAKEEAMLRVKKLSESYEETRKSNRELTNELKAEKDWITTTYSNATPEQVAYLQSSPAALQALKKMKDPTKISLSDVISIASGNESNAVIADRITAMPEVADKVAAAVKNQYRSGLGGFIDRVGEGAGETAERRFARAMGSDIDTLRDTKPMQRPTQAGTFDVARTLETTPDSVEDMVKAANVARVQAKQKFGEGSVEYKTANETFTSLSGEIEKTDKGLDARANRLNIAILDETDPAKKKALQSELKITQQAIKQHKEATSTRDEKGEDKPKTYGVISRSVDDFVNTRMREDKGFDWRKYVDFKTFTDPATGQTITSRTQKANLSDEQQRELFAKERELTAQALVTNGYVVNGKPRYNEVAEIMNNRGITPQSFGAAPPAPAAPAAPTPAPTTPAAIPTAQPTKTVSAAKVAEQAKANNVTYEQAAAEARKQGYTIR